jgi:DnaJ domain
MGSKLKDYYAILGVPGNASDEDIKHAYRLLSKVWHPDTNKRKDAEDRFREINEAKNILLNPVERAAYDRKFAASDDTSISDTDDNVARDAETEISVEPGTVDFGVLKFGEPGVDAEITVSWSGLPPRTIVPNPRGADWWELGNASLSIDRSFYVFPLYAEAYDGMPSGEHRSHIDFVADGTVYQVKLKAQVVSEPGKPMPTPAGSGSYYTRPTMPSPTPAGTGSPAASRKRRTISLWALVITVAALLVGIIVAVNVNQADQRAAQQRAAMIVCDSVFTVTDFVQVVMRPPSNTFYWGTPTYSANECEYELTWGPNLETDVQITVACGGDAQSSWNQFKSQYGGTASMGGFPQAIESTDSTEAAALTPKDQFVEAYLQAISNPDIQTNPLVSHEGAVLAAILHRAYNNESQRNVC